MANKTNTNNTLEDYPLQFEDLPTKAQLDRKKAKLDKERAIQLEKDKRAKARVKAKRKKQGSIFTRLKNKLGAFIWV